MQLFFIIFTVLGGLALFIFGMNIMTEGLRQAVGAGLQKLLGRTTRTASGGFLLGTGLGTTIHSSAGSVMLVGFVNAGLMTLEQSIAPMLGANFGTTLSMQVISLQLTDYAFVAIAFGLGLTLLAPTDKGKSLGRALLGFGLLFHGMDLMSGAIKPHRETLAVFLRGVDGDTYSGLFLGILMAGGLTAVWQSSGATIAITFALISAGVFTEFSQVFPIVLGSHLGTCATSLLGSLGANVEARRCAFSHLLFNLFNVLLAVLLQPLFYWFIPLISNDLTRQTANLHSAVMLAAAVVILPFTHRYAGLIRKLFFPRAPMPQSSFLDYHLLDYPERGIKAVIAELRRVSRICLNSFNLTGRVILLTHDRKCVAGIKKNEAVIDDIKETMGDYIFQMTQKYLSRRQIILYHHLLHCMSDIERIGDHIEQLAQTSLRRQVAALDQEAFETILDLYRKTHYILTLIVKGFDPEANDFALSGKELHTARNDYRQASTEAKRIFLKKAQKHNLSPGAALYFKEYIAVLDRLSRHVKNISQAMEDEDF